MDSPNGLEYVRFQNGDGYGYSGTKVASQSNKPFEQLIQE